MGLKRSGMGSYGLDSSGSGYAVPIAQAVSRWLPTAAARVRVRAACDVCGGRSGTGVSSFEYFGFPCQSSFHQFLYHNNHIRPISGRSAEWTQLDYTPPPPL
jgi:hypothetical protein